MCDAKYRKLSIGRCVNQRLQGTPHLRVFVTVTGHSRNYGVNNHQASAPGVTDCTHQLIHIASGVEGVHAALVSRALNKEDSIGITASRQETWKQRICGVVLPGPDNHIPGCAT